LNRELSRVQPNLIQDDYIQVANSLALSLGQKLTNDNSTIATAESCTGGRLSAAITSVSGSSAYFMEGVCTYSNDSKIKYCNVKIETLEDHGAVSGQVAEEMAAGIRAAANSTYGISTTGIAGPTGGTSAKPIGTVYLGLATEDKTEHKKLFLNNLERSEVTACSTLEALKFIIEELDKSR